MMPGSDTEDVRELTEAEVANPLLWTRISAASFVTVVCSGGWVVYYSFVGAVPLSLRTLFSLSGALTTYSIFRTLKSSSTRLLHGSARWRSSQDAGFSSIRSMPILSPEAFFLGSEDGSEGRLVELPGVLARQHGIIVGGTGTGKTRGFFLPTAAFIRGESLLCTDPKSELWRHTSGYHARATRYAPTEPEESACFNWIPLCKEARYAELCARTLIESGEDGPRRAEAVWIEAESAFLGALFAHAATLPEPTPITAYRLFARQKQDALLKQLKASSSEVAREQAIVFEQTQERMRGSIVPAVAAKLQFLRDPKIAQFTSAAIDACDFGRLRHRPEAMYWCLQEADMTRLRPLTSLFFTLIFEQIARAALPDSPDAIPVRVLLDEFANVGSLPHFDSTISLSRSRGLSLWLGVQSLSQLEDRYGKPAAQTILANCATKIILSGLDIDSAEYVSRTLGQSTVVTSRRSWNLRHLFGATGSVSYRQTETMRPLLTPDEVRRLGSREVLVVSANRAPVLLHRYIYKFQPVTAGASALGAVRSSIESATPLVQTIEANRSNQTKTAPVPKNDSHESAPPALPADLIDETTESEFEDHNEQQPSDGARNSSQAKPFRFAKKRRGTVRVKMRNQ